MLDAFAYIVNPSYIQCRMSCQLTQPTVYFSSSGQSRQLLCVPQMVTGNHKLLFSVEDPNAMALRDIQVNPPSNEPRERY